MELTTIEPDVYDGTAWLEAVMKSQGADVWAPNSNDLPLLIANHPTAGLIAFGAPGTDAMVALNRQVARLREAVTQLARTQVTRQLVDEAFLGQVEAGDWGRRLPIRSYDAALSDALNGYLGPRVVISVPARSSMRDAGRTGRAETRLQLDASQAHVARRDVDHMLAISGPPGSGKTLVLCARAVWLAEEHPDWDIRILCYNRMLVPYLRRLTAEHPQITVSTMGQFASSLRVRISLDDPRRAQLDFARAKRLGLQRCVDAILVDEWQDFFPAWTSLAEHMLRPGRGGLVVAGDPKQALYHDAGMALTTQPRLETVTLTRPYRSTRQILQVTTALGDSLGVDHLDEAPDGEPVDLVWATNQAEQAAAVARDIQLLLQDGQREPQDIGVLVTRKWTMGGIARALSAVSIPFDVIYHDRPEALDLAAPRVKILTVHSAKGLEFDVVFLVGLEQLPNPDGTQDVDRHGRAGYVGATRARDQLVLTYSKDNAYLERIRALPEETMRRWVWPDDYPEE